MAALPALAYAHGQDVLVTIYAELLTVFFVVLTLRLVSTFRPFWFGGTAACVFGVFASWFAVAGIPYSANQTIVTAISVILPLLTTGAYLAWRRNGVSR